MYIVSLAFAFVNFYKKKKGIKHEFKPLFGWFFVKFL